MTDKQKSNPSPNPSKITFQEVLDAMLNESKPFHPRYLYRLSDLEAPELKQLEEVWARVETQRRRSILQDIEELEETNYTLSFEDFCLLTVKDGDPHVRQVSVEALWEYENPRLVPLYLDLLANDSNLEVRAAAAAALGKYVYLGETEELPEKTLNLIVDSLLEVYRNAKSQQLRCSTLESLGYSSREEVSNLIENAYHSGNQDWVTSSLVAIGRTANAQWEPHVMESLESDVDEIRYEAARAAGELEIKKATPVLLEMLNDSESEMRMAAAWSLSQIGGEGIEDALIQLYEETEDEEEADFIDLALDNLTFTEDMQLFPIVEMSPDELDEEEDDEWDELYESDEEDE